MIGHLDLETPLEDSLDHPVDQPIRPIDRHPGRLGIGQQGINPVRPEQLAQSLRSLRITTLTGLLGIGHTVSLRAAGRHRDVPSAKLTAPRSGRRPYTEDLTRPNASITCSGARSLTSRGTPMSCWSNAAARTISSSNRSTPNPRPR